MLVTKFNQVPYAIILAVTMQYLWISDKNFLFTLKIWNHIYMCKPRLTYGKLHTLYFKNPTYKQLMSSVEYHGTFR